MVIILRVLIIIIIFFLISLYFSLKEKANKKANKKAQEIRSQKYEIELKERKKKQLEIELKELKAKEEELRKFNLEKEARERFLESKKEEVYYYTESMLVKLIEENNDWKGFFNCVKKYDVHKKEIDLYDTKDFYIENSWSRYTDIGSVRLINKTNGKKTNIYNYGYGLYDI